MRRTAVLLLFTALLASAWAYPVELKLEDGTRLVGAVIEAEKLDGEKVTFTTGADGSFTVQEVPLGILKLRVLSWKNIPLGYEYVVTPYNSTVIIGKIHVLSVYVRGSRGQALTGARVAVYYGDTPVEEGLTENGLYATRLPEGSYRLEVSYANRRGSALVTVHGPAEQEVTLDVFLEVGGVALSQSEFVAAVLLAAVVIIGLYIILYEYGVWRRKRLLTRIAPSS